MSHALFRQYLHDLYPYYKVFPYYYLLNKVLENKTGQITENQ